MRPGSAVDVRVLISRLNRLLLKEPKGVQLGGFGGQLACSRAAADLEIIVSGGGGGRVQA